MTPPRLSQVLARSIPNAQFSVIEQGGHMVMIEHPDLVANLLSGFVQSIAL
jgi:pimeloyl-ACP methyl ester carboxylesterase